MSAWWRWPEDKRSGRVAWFVVLRRLIFWPVYAAGLCLATAGVFLMYGAREAGNFWRDAT